MRRKTLTKASINRYPKQIVSGKIPACKWVRLACERHLRDLENDELFFDVKAADRAVRFIETLPHTKGKWASKAELIVLADWQLFIVAVIFGWKVKSTGKRRFREIYVEVARKNGKSTLLAAIGLFMMVADGEFGAEVYSGATSEKQAWEVFRPARLMAKRTPALCEHFDIEVNASNLIRLSDFSKFEPVIGNPGDGPSPSCAIVDEYHEHKNSDLYDTMITGMGAREEPLILTITTAGVDISGPCFEKRTEVQKILNGTFAADDVFGIIYTIDEADSEGQEADDWKDPAVWRKANPNLGISVNEDYLKAQVAAAIRSPSKQTTVKTKHLNIWSGARSVFLNMERWRLAGDETLNPEDFHGLPCWVGLDMATRVDLAARVSCFLKYIDGERHYYLFPHFYLPEGALDTAKNAKIYQGWAIDGHLNLMDGEETSFQAVEDELKGLGHEVEEFAYDPWQTTQIAQNLRAERLTATEFRHTVGNMSPAMREVEAALLAGRIHHNDNPALNWCVSNMVAKEDAKSNVYPRKETEDAKIDGAVALLMAVGRAMYDERKPTLSNFLASIE